MSYFVLSFLVSLYFFIFSTLLFSFFFSFCSLFKPFVLPSAYVQAAIWPEKWWDLHGEFLAHWCFWACNLVKTPGLHTVTVLLGRYCCSGYKKVNSR